MNSPATWRYRIACVVAAAVVASISAHADQDEAWLARAELPAGTRPLLALIIDDSAAAAQEIDVAEPYDPLRDYALDLPDAVRCDPMRAYWRRGPGPAPDCLTQSGLDLAPTADTHGLQCDGARTAIARHGFFIASRAAQWRPTVDSGHWSALRPESPAAVECRSDLARDGAATAGEIAWDRFPLADPYIFYGGNFLNYLRGTPARLRRAFADHAALSIASALEATDELDVTQVRVSDRDGAPAGDASLAETPAEAFTHPCRPITPGFLTPGQVSDDALAYINLVARAHQHDAAVAGMPQLSAAAPGVVFGLTAPLKSSRWAGNLFRYRLQVPAGPFLPPVIVDRHGEPAMDAASGLPRVSSSSLWSDTPDSSLLTGGAAGRLPAAGLRQLFADLGSPRLLDAGNRLAPGNPRIDRALLGLGAFDTESTDEVLSWLAATATLGDTGLHAPVIADYPASGEQLVFATTQDGLLHAFDMDTGIERWAFMPRQLLGRLPGLMRDQPTTVRDHGIDAAPVLHRHDPDGDGVIDADAGEHLWLLFGLGRGGHRYVALDITVADDPKLLWSIALPAGTAVESRAEPVVTRLAIAGSGQSDGDWVVLLAGGYDRQFDTQGAVAGAGNLIQIVDAQTGRLLWQAGGEAGADLRWPELATSLPSAPRALDLDGDLRLDRLYLADVTGGLWRLDFRDGSPADRLAEVRRVAQLGTGAQRFHATPDVSLARVAGRDRIAIAAGSGWLAQPRDATIVDRIYVVFDGDPIDGATVLSEADLHDASDGLTPMPASAQGWFRRLDRQGAGEKVIGATVTFDHVLRFQTYRPLPVAEAAPCGPPRAVHRMYALDIRSGQPHSSAVEEPVDDEQPTTGLPAGPRFGFPAAWAGACPDCRPRPFGIRGAETFDPGYSGDPVKTSWRKLPLPPDSR